MNKKALGTIFLVIFIDLLGFGILIPILPYYATSFGASATVLGLLMMSYSLMQFIFSPFWGRLSDKVGRRPVLLTTIAGIGASMVVLGFAKSLAWLFVGRLLAGFFGANISTASAYIADVTPPEDRAKGMGLIGAAFGLGFLFGPAIGGFLSQWGYGMAAFAAAALSAINWVVALATLKEPPLSEEIRQTHRNEPGKSALVQALSQPQTRLPIFLFFLVTMGMAQLETTFGLFVLSRFGLTAQGAGYLLAIMAIVMVLIQGGGIGKLAKAFGEARLAIFGTTIMALTLAGAGLSASLPLFVTALVCYAIGYAVTNPSLLSLTSKGAPEGRQGGIMGIYQSAGSLARILGPICAGLLFDYYGIAAPMMIASLFFVLGLVTLVTKQNALHAQV